MLRCGVDMVEVTRIAASAERFGDRFYRRFFTENEIADCGMKSERLAARIAAKEAVAKALGTGIGRVSWHEIEVRIADSGRPYLNLYGEAVVVAEGLGLHEWDISLTHTLDHAVAMVVATD